MKTVNSNMPYFMGYVEPNGFLDMEAETHALWNYYLCARGAYERTVKHVIAIEGEDDPQANMLQLAKSMAELYGTTLEAMMKCWDRVDKQCDYLGLPRLPDEERYRFNRAIIVKH